MLFERPPTLQYGEPSAAPSSSRETASSIGPDADDADCSSTTTSSTRNSSRTSSAAAVATSKNQQLDHEAISRAYPSRKRLVFLANAVKSRLAKRPDFGDIPMFPVEGKVRGEVD